MRVSAKASSCTESVIRDTDRALVTLHEPDWSIDEAELRAAFSDRTRASIVNTPHNPAKVFSRAELELISELCNRYDALVMTDEIYEHILRQEAGFGVSVPDGAYYVMCATDAHDADRDVAFAGRLFSEIGVAAVPGSSFYADRQRGAGQVRFAFPKRLETLSAAAERLARLRR